MEGAAASSEAQSDDLFLVMLRAGSSDPGLSAERVAELSAGHMENINRLADQEVLLIAGPLASTTDARGIFVLRASDAEAARAIVASDPAVSAGLLTAEVSSFASADAFARIPELQRAARQAREAKEPGTADAFDMAAYTLAHTTESEGVDAALERLVQGGQMVFSGRVTEGANAGVWVALAESDPMQVADLLRRAGGELEWSSLTWYASAQLAHLPRLGARADAPTFEVLALDERFAPFGEEFDRRVDVFGLQALATESVSDRRLLHASHLLAQYLDNDEDGHPDDERVFAALLEGGAFLVMAGSEREARRLDPDWAALETAGFLIGQDLYDEETRPYGPPHVRVEGRFDAALEEVWHLVSNGWAEAYPESFGYEPGSALCVAMDLARGGRFERVPRRYPQEAWYHYDDRTCDYGCMAAEYFYWTLTTLLGGQDYPGRAEEIAVEWECTTAESLERIDPAVFALLTDERFQLPVVLPDGSYGP